VPVSELVLIRHGESMGNAAAAEANAANAEVIVIDLRDADVPLSPVGVQQAEALSIGLGPLVSDSRPHLVWSSPYVRAVQTAEVALGKLGVRERIAVDERLRDRELGVLDLLTTRGVAVRYPIEAQRRSWLGKFYHRPPGGESWADVVLRIRSFLRDLDSLPGLPEDARVIIVCHDALVLLFRYVCQQLSERELLEIGATDPVRNVSITQFARTDDARWELVRYNDVSHLEQAGAPITEHRGEVDVRANQ
jgi:broad specificity phosphatase PhoE